MSYNRAMEQTKTKARDPRAKKLRDFRNQGKCGHSHCLMCHGEKHLRKTARRRAHRAAAPYRAAW